MCGIVAMFSQRPGRPPLERTTLIRAIAALDHRGPDERGDWLAADGRTALGHARLSIIDLTTGRQPLASEDGRVRAVVNGELYDFERMRGELEARGHRFATRSDSELLVHLYEEHGTAFVSQLRGEVAFVLYDEANDLLVAGRDRFGIKPLHYATIDGALVLASEAKALFAAGLPARWDLESVFQSTVLGGPLDDRTFFEGVHQVPAGCLLVATRTSQRVVRYWDFDYPRADELASTSEADDVAELRALLDDAVRVRLRADVPVACYLSGGLDSCAVLGLAAAQSAQPIRAFTLAFDRDGYDESPIAREMAARAGATYTEVPVGEVDFARDFTDALWHAERPLNNANSAAKFRLSRAVRDAGIKVVLTGEGSDEIFAGYPHYRADLARHDARAAAALAQANAVSRGMLLPDGDALSADAIRRAIGFVPTWIEAFATTGKKMHGLLAPDYAARFGARDPLHTFAATLELDRQLAHRHPTHQAMYLWSKSVLPNYILSVLGDRMEMAHSIEGRLPFLDHHVVERVARMPVERLIHGSVEKHVLREAARPVLTDTVYRRQKHPFFAPPTSSAPGGPLHALLQDTLRGPALAAVPFYDRRRVLGLLDSLPDLPAEARTAVDPALMIILSATLMQQRFGLA